MKSDYRFAIEKTKGCSTLQDTGFPFFWPGAQRHCFSDSIPAVAKAG
jgi:hypothetical protein